MKALGFRCPKCGQVSPMVRKQVQHTIYPNGEEFIDEYLPVVYEYFDCQHIDYSEPQKFYEKEV